MSRKYNFCAGPSALPTDVLNDLKDEILDFQGYGLSTMEMSHRSKEFVEIAETAKPVSYTHLTLPTRRFV